MEQPCNRVGLVLTSGGARGAHRAGALSVLLPELARRGQSPRILAGSSAGALWGRRRASPG